MKRHLLVLSILALTILGCSNDKSTSPNQPTEYTFTFDFETTAEGWVGGFSDYPVGEEAFHELTFQRVPLPENIDPDAFALEISGNNHSDDLFMFLKKKITGLKPNTLYDLTFTLEIASQYPQNSQGIGGSPGASVYLKVGAVQIEPAPVDSNGFYEMNIDKSNQAGSGSDMVVIGTIGIPGDAFVYTLIQRDNTGDPFPIQSNADGAVWVIVGTDSGFEGITTLYYDTIQLRFVES